MQRLFHMAAGVALMYIVYMLAFKRWDYESETKRQQRNILLKQQGLSTRYYFISAPWLLVLNLLSGGGFFFYWFYKQWQAVREGFKRTDKKPLQMPPWLRTVFFMFSLYQFNAILNRTCIYMRKRASFPAMAWGTLIWAAPLAAAMPCLKYSWRIVAGAIFLLLPVILQRRINTLPKAPPSIHIKPFQLLWVLFCWVIWLAAAIVYKQFQQAYI